MARVAYAGYAYIYKAFKTIFARPRKAERQRKISVVHPSVGAFRASVARFAFRALFAIFSVSAVENVPIPAIFTPFILNRAKFARPSVTKAPS